MAEHIFHGHEQRLAKILDKVGVVWEEFCSLYPSEEACWFALFDALSANNALFCRSCHSVKVQFAPLSRSTRCQNCYKVTWLTAGTVFHGARKLRPWMAAIWLFENGIKISSSGFSFLLQIAQSSALNMYKSIFLVLNSEGQEPLAQVSSSLFLAIFNKRSLETYNRQHPVTEETMQDKNFQEFSSGASGAPELHSDSPQAETGNREEGKEGFSEYGRSPLEEQIIALLADGERTFDEICRHTGFACADINEALTNLELDLKIVSIMGGKYGLVIEEPSLSKYSKESGHSKNAGAVSADLKLAVESFCLLIKKEFHGISRKTIALYSALRKLPLTDQKLEKLMNSRLLTACLFREPIGRQEIRLYVSPQFFPFVTAAAPAQI